MCRAGRTAAAGRSRRCAAPRPPVEVADDGAMERLQVPEVVAAGDALAGQPGQSIVADLGLHRGQIGHAGGLDSPPTPGAPAAPASTSPPNPASTSCRPPTRPTHTPASSRSKTCLLYTSDAADEEDSVDLGGRRIIKKKIENTYLGTATRLV